jgi:NACalpha-BTF3-like transcription factor
MVVFSFANNVSVQGATVSAGTGSAGNFTVVGKQVTVDLIGVTNAQTMVVKLLGVSDGTNTSDVEATMVLLLGDTSSNRAVNSTDISQTQSQSGQTVTADNFREDVTVNGSINSSDIALVQAQSGTGVSQARTTLQTSAPNFLIRPLPLPPAKDSRRPKSH